MTADDFRYTFFERIKAGHVVDTKNSWRKVSDIEVQSPIKAIMRFSSQTHGAAMARFPRQLLAPKKYLGDVGVEKFRDKPMVPVLTSSLNINSMPERLWSATTLIGDPSRK